MPAILILAQLAAGAITAAPPPVDRIAVTPLLILGRDTEHRSLFEGIFRDELRSLNVPALMVDAPSAEDRDDKALADLARNNRAARALSVMVVTRPQKWLVTAKIVRSDGLLERFLSDQTYDRPASGGLDGPLRSALRQTLLDLRVDALELYPLVPAPAQPAPSAPGMASRAGISPLSLSLIAGGGAMLGLGGFLSWSSMRTWDEYNALPQTQAQLAQLSALKRRAEMQRWGGLASVAVGTAAAGIGVWQWMSGSAERQPIGLLEVGPAEVRVTFSLP